MDESDSDTSITFPRFHIIKSKELAHSQKRNINAPSTSFDLPSSSNINKINASKKKVTRSKKTPKKAKRNKNSKNDKVLVVGDSDSGQENNKNDSDFELRKRKYLNMGPKELNKFALRVKIFNDTGITVSDKEDETYTPTQQTKKRRLRKRKSTQGCVINKVIGKSTPRSASRLTENTHKRVQDYINSITPNRVDYVKENTVQIIETINYEKAESPMVSQEEIQRILDKHKDYVPTPVIIQRVDYNKSATPIFSLPSTSYQESDLTTDTKLEDNDNGNASTSKGLENNRNVINSSEIVDLDLSPGNSEADTKTSGLFIDRLLPISEEILNSPNVTVQRPTYGRVQDLMTFVDELVNNKEAIIQEVQDKYERLENDWLKTEKRLSEAARQILFSDEVFDDSVEFVTCYDLSTTDCVKQENTSDNKNTSNNKRKLSTVIDLCDTSLESVTDVANSADKPQNSEQQPPSILRECPICLEHLGGKELSATICGHIFCTACIQAVVRYTKKCPNCRKHLTLKKIHPLFV